MSTTARVSALFVPKVTPSIAPPLTSAVGITVVPVKVSGWLSQSNNGKNYQALNIEPVYSKQKEIEESDTNNASPSNDPPSKKEEEDFPF